MSLEIKVTHNASHCISVLLSTNGLEASACDTLPVHPCSVFLPSHCSVCKAVKGSLGGAGVWWCFDGTLCMRPAAAAFPLYNSTPWPSSTANLLELPELLKPLVLDAPVTTVDVTQQTSTQTLTHRCGSAAALPVQRGGWRQKLRQLTEGPSARPLMWDLSVRKRLWMLSFDLFFFSFKSFGKPTWTKRIIFFQL